MLYKMLEGPLNDPGPPPVDQMSELNFAKVFRVKWVQE